MSATNQLGEGVEYGPFFFVQVKSTAATAAKGNGVPVRLRPAEMRAIQARKVPSYLVGVRSAVANSEEVYAIAIDASLRNGIAVIPSVFSLRQEEIRLKIYDEVHAYFQSGVKTFRSQLTLHRRT
ncbi:hypothetical protein GJ699_32120 [Duganella sp. FT80W]|uniref:DUF4365 domain-containing protein n=1 Tax=Duganella guangzhouensis TaxID=2666084 RepID=A0A6I2LCS2_9BURK|nr:hypothetical protein [Duganella guangzhouensis]MRW94624.1 hypothetical protein [Duganella guangzhouensis]